jgi:microcystin-dependent protein
MSTLNRLEPLSDLTKDAGRGQLQETLDLLAAELRRTREELELVKAADRIVQPVPIEEFPLAAGAVAGSSASVEVPVGMIVARGSSSVPSGWLECDGSAVSRTTYADLFAEIGEDWGAGNGTTTFNVPDLRGRTLIGVGTGTGLTARALATLYGSEDVKQHRHGHNHTHSTPAHAHTMAHTHEFPHTHNTAYQYGGAGGANPVPDLLGTASSQSLAANKTTASQSTTTTGQPSTSVTSTDGSGTSGAPSSTDTDNAGGGTDNLQPSAAATYLIRYESGSGGSSAQQTLPIAWGRVNALWELDTSSNFPVTQIDNVHELATAAGDRPGALVRVTAENGSGVGNTSAVKIVGVLPIPYNFRRWKPDAFKIVTCLRMTGCGVGTSAMVTLRVSDPVTAGAYLADTYSRTLNVSGGTIEDAGAGAAQFVVAKITEAMLGRDWKPGYMFRFELLWNVPKTFTECFMTVGLLTIDWR